MSNALLFGTAY